jgi:class 3 adenylate cyclase
MRKYLAKSGRSGENSTGAARNRRLQCQYRMKIRNAVISLTCRSLYETFGTDMMVRLARMVIPGYDIYSQTGLPNAIPIPTQTAAQRVVKDVIARECFLPFAETLIHVDAHGYMGREYRVNRIMELVKAILAEGFLYDRETGLFMENSKERVSTNWGRLEQGEERNFALLRLDIVKNSRLVKSNPKDKIESAYAELRSIVSRSVLGRKGRVWFWEGDGCLCSFLYGQKERSALLSGMHILNDLYFYNLTANPLSAPIQLRLSAHCGPLRFSADSLDIKKAEAVREVTDFESKHTQTDSFTVSPNLFLGVDRVIQDKFGPERRCGAFKLRAYAIGLEDA